MSRRVPLQPRRPSPCEECSGRARPGRVRRRAPLATTHPRARSPPTDPWTRVDATGLRDDEAPEHGRCLDRRIDLDAPYPAALPTRLVGDSPKTYQLRCTRSGFHRTTERSACSSERRSTPSSVTFCTSQSSRSPFGMATASVKVSVRGGSVLISPAASRLSDEPSTHTVARIQRPPPSVTLTRSPSRRRNTRRR